MTETRTLPEPNDRVGVGEWILVDEDLLLLTLGSTTFHGTSLRKQLTDHIAREILLPAFKTALAEEEPVDRVVERDGVQWAVFIDLLRSPLTHEVFAFQGVMHRVDEPRPPRMLVGALEWLITTQPEFGMQIHWDLNMLKVYEFDESAYPAGDVSSFAAPRWYADLVAPKDQGRFRVIVDEVITAVSQELHSITYDVVTGYGKPDTERGTKTLRVAGRAAGDPGDTTFYLRGVVHEALDEKQDLYPGKQVVSDDMVRALLKLSSDIQAAVDTRTWHVFQVTQGWKNAGLSVTTEGGFLDLVTPGDRPLVREFLLDAANKGNIDRPLIAQVRDIDGRLTFRSIRANGFEAGSEKNRYVYVKLSAA